MGSTETIGSAAPDAGEAEETVQNKRRSVILNSSAGFGIGIVAFGIMAYTIFGHPAAGPAVDNSAPQVVTVTVTSESPTNVPAVPVDTTKMPDSPACNAFLAASTFASTPGWTSIDEPYSRFIAAATLAVDPQLKADMTAQANAIKSENQTSTALSDSLARCRALGGYTEDTYMAWLTAASSR